MKSAVPEPEVPREARYSTVEKECLAIKWALGSLRYYLLGQEFDLHTDHQALTWIQTMKDNNARVTRWHFNLSSLWSIIKLEVKTSTQTTCPTCQALASLERGEQCDRGLCHSLQCHLKLSLSSKYCVVSLTIAASTL